VTLSLLAAFLLQTGDLVLNGGFETTATDMPSEWKAIAPAEFQKAVEFALDKRDSGKCARLRNTNPRNRQASSFAQKIDCSGLRGRAVDITGWIRTHEATLADIRVMCLDEGELEIASVGVRRYGGVWGTTEWKQYAGRGLVPARTRQLHVRCTIQGIGEAWFDDVTLVPAKEEGNPPPALSEEHARFREAASKFILGTDRDAIRAFADWLPDRVAAALAGGLGPAPWASGWKKFGTYDVWIPREARTSARPLLVVVSSEKDAHKAWVELGATDLFVARTDALDALFLRDICARLPVDPDRIFATGTDGTQIWDRLGGVALFDQTPDRLPIVPCWFAGARGSRQQAYVDRLQGRGVEIVPRCHEEAGSDGFLIDRGSALDWLVARPRESNPRRVARVGHWLQADGTATGQVDGNTVTLTCERTKEVRILLNPRLVDFVQPVKVVVNGRTVHEGKVSASFDAFLERLAETGDSAEPCWARLEFKVE
jgi:hypothetical protein